MNFKVLVCVIGLTLDMIGGITSAEVTGGENYPTPSDVWMETFETSITIHWTAPLNDVCECGLLYKTEDIPNDTKIVPISVEQNWYVISNLRWNTLYEIRFYCFCGTTFLLPTEWIGASTRTVSAEGPTVCPGTLPGAVLSPSCIRDPNRLSCDVTCRYGYQKLPYSYGGVYCEKGKWANYNNNFVHGFREICLPKAEFEKCPLSIPNGALEPDCGPATDWLCQFDCNEGYHKHSYMFSRLKGFMDPKYTTGLFCECGTWKTGYENFGIDVSGVCVPEERNCTEAVPNGNVYSPCPSGHSCTFTCDDGFRLHPIAQDYMKCENGEWVLSATKYDRKITPQTVCLPEEAVHVCSSMIPNGRIESGCTETCYPECDEGYYLPYTIMPARYFVTCLDGKWWTSDYAYNGDNICFPSGGHPCPREIANGLANRYDREETDIGNGRERTGTYICNDGFRRNRMKIMIECIAGKWLTGLERFGIDESKVCVPMSPNEWYRERE